MYSLKLMFVQDYKYLQAAYIYNIRVAHCRGLIQVPWFYSDGNSICIMVINSLRNTVLVL